MAVIQRRLSLRIVELCVNTFIVIDTYVVVRAIVSPACMSISSRHNRAATSSPYGEVTPDLPSLHNR